MNHPSDHADLEVHVHVFHHGEPDPRIDQILTNTHHLIHQENTLMTTVSDVDAKVDELATAESSLSDAIGAEQSTLQAQHAELVKLIEDGGSADPAALQAVADKLDAQVSSLGSLKDAVDAAVAANPDPGATPPSTDPPAGNVPA